MSDRVECACAQDRPIDEFPACLERPERGAPLPVHLVMKTPAPGSSGIGSASMQSSDKCADLKTALCIAPPPAACESHLAHTETQSASHLAWPSNGFPGRYSRALACARSAARSGKSCMSSMQVHRSGPAPYDDVAMSRPARRPCGSSDSPDRSRLSTLSQEATAEDFRRAGTFPLHWRYEDCRRRSQPLPHPTSPATNHDPWPAGDLERDCRQFFMRRRRCFVAAFEAAIAPAKRIIANRTDASILANCQVVSPSSIARSWRARFTRLFTVPTAQLQISAVDR